MADYSLLEKYESIRYRFEEVGSQITDPSVMSDMKPPQAATASARRNAARSAGPLGLRQRAQTWWSGRSSTSVPGCRS